MADGRYPERKKHLFSIFLVFVVTVNFSATQDEIEMVTTTTTQEPLSNAICSTCVCADSVVNCANLNITSFFEIPDWDGLQNMRPTTVNLSQNPITTISRISRLPIEVLNVSNCQVTILEDASFIYLENLSVLDLSKNQISTSAINRKVFCGPIGTDLGPRDFKKMQYLSLAYNDLHSLNQDIFLFMPGLTFLDLSGNPLAYIDQVTMGAISDLKNLRELRLSGCELDTLPEGLLRRQRKLRRLDLSDNRFTTIPAVLKEAPNLVYLNLDRISLQTLEADSALSNLSKLQELHLSRLSRLQNITAGAFAGLADLMILRMAHNPRLSYLDPDFMVWKNEDGDELWPNVKELYLNNNNLSGIHSGILDNWHELETGDFSNNPFICDCRNQWMVDVLVPLMSNNPAAASLSNMVCKKPAELRGLSFTQLYNTSKTLTCPEPENITELQVSNMAILLGIMIGIMVTFPLVLILVLLWRRGFFARFRKHKKYPRDDPYGIETENL